MPRPPRWRALGARLYSELVERLSDPGTMRSLCWACMGFIGVDRGETEVSYWAGIAAILLGLVSAALPPRRPRP